jgi:hypothetical protein
MPFNFQRLHGCGELWVDRGAGLGEKLSPWGDHLKSIRKTFEPLLERDG